MTFHDFTLDSRLHQALEAAGYVQPTPVQEAALPLALAGRDLIATAQTGTGKTAAFVLPILQALLSNPDSLRRHRALVVAPTRELAEQIHQTVVKLGRHTGIHSATLYGGVGMQPQEKALARGVEILVACPGRLLDHVQQGTARLDTIQYLVLDEADRMLDMGFLPDIQRIIKLLPTQRQTMLFSATFDPQLRGLIAHAVRNPERIEIGHVAPAHTIAHALYPVTQHLKTSLLLKILETLEGGSVLVFTRTKHRANRLAEKIQRQGHGVGILHSNKSQSQRQSALEGFRSGKHRLLVATDIAARGIDVSTITHVINYDIPDSATTYIHRIGRTGRAERTGDAITLITREDSSLVMEIERALKQPIERKTLEGFDYHAQPQEELSGRLTQPAGGESRQGADDENLSGEGGRGPRRRGGRGGGRGGRPGGQHSQSGGRGARPGGQSSQGNGHADSNFQPQGQPIVHRMNSGNAGRTHGNSSQARPAAQGQHSSNRHPGGQENRAGHDQAARGHSPSGRSDSQGAPVHARSSRGPRGHSNGARKNQPSSGGNSAGPVARFRLRGPNGGL